MSRVLVIGGRGYYGRRVVEALTGLRDVQVVVAGRSGDVHLDLGDPATYVRVDGYDVVVSCADAVNAPTDGLARYALAHGHTLLDMGADTATADRLLAEPVAGARGTVILGVGVFPGLSTALAVDAAQAAGSPERVEVAVRLSPLSGAGPANVALMTHTLSTPSLSWEDGRRVEGPPVGAVARVPFLGAGPRAAAVVPLPDAPLVRHATGAPTVHSRMSLAPDVLLPTFRASVTLIRWAGPMRGLLLALLRAYLHLVRVKLLGSRESAVALTASAEPGAVRRLVWVDDGQRATALGVAFAVERVLAKDFPGPGLHVAGRCWPAAAWVEGMRRMGTDGFTLRYEASGGAAGG